MFCGIGELLLSSSPANQGLVISKGSPTPLDRINNGYPGLMIIGISRKTLPKTSPTP